MEVLSFWTKDSICKDIIYSNKSGKIEITLLFDINITRDNQNASYYKEHSFIKNVFHSATARIIFCSKKVDIEKEVAGYDQKILKLEDNTIGYSSVYPACEWDSFHSKMKDIDDKKSIQINIYDDIKNFELIKPIIAKDISNIKFDCLFCIEKENAVAIDSYNLSYNQ